MKKVYIAYAFEGGKITPHKHPVFTGEIAHDLANEQTVQVNEKLDVREFTSPGEAVAAIQDYIRETPGADGPGDFVLIETYTAVGGAKPKTKEVKTKKSK